MKVVGVTKQNENNEDIQQLLRDIAKQYETEGKLTPWQEEDEEGYIYEDQTIKGAARLEEEPTNPYDKNAIKVYLKDKHVGYIPREHTNQVKEALKQLQRVDVMFTGGTYRREDEGDEELTMGLDIDIITVKDWAADTPFLQKGDGSTKTKAKNGMGCLIAFLIVFLFILILI